jgi:hypothetical protein
MKIIDIAVCVNNNDPKQIGRIRCIRFSDWISQKSKGVVYEKWDDKDTFLANPFLPTNINYVPEVGQIVKVLNYNTDKETINQEYIAGPFTTLFDYNSQTFSQQVENTTYGVAVKHRKDVIKENGELVDGRTEGAIAVSKDYAVYGPYGSDVLFTENGLQLRGGKLISKEFANRKDKENLLNFPIMADTYSKISLKKFSKKMELKPEQFTERIIEKGRLKYIIEYDTNDLTFTGTTQIQIHVYKIVKNKDMKDPNANLFDTDFFTEFTEIPSGYTQLVTGSTLDYTYSEEVDTVTGAYITINDILSTIDEKNLSEIDPLLTKEDLHPFFFRPSKNFRERTMNMGEQSSDRDSIIKNVQIIGTDGGSGLVWSILSASPPVKEKKGVRNVLRTVTRNREQSFASVVSDKLYLLSMDTNETNKSKPIEFKKLNKYEYTQDDYLQTIEPNTYSSVRGENLINLLKSICNVLMTHKHNLNDSYSKTQYNQHNELQQLLETLETDILNKSIRIN